MATSISKWMQKSSGSDPPPLRRRRRTADVGKSDREKREHTSQTYGATKRSRTSDAASPETGHKQDSSARHSKPATQSQGSSFVPTSLPRGSNVDMPSHTTPARNPLGTSTLPRTTGIPPQVLAQFQTNGIQYTPTQDLNQSRDSIANPEEIQNDTGPLSPRRPATYPRLFGAGEDLTNRFWAQYHAQRARPRSDGKGLNNQIQYRPYTKPVKLEVTRGNYKTLENYVMNFGLFATVVGPTACGKSTYALLDILRLGISILLIQPSSINVASCMANFTKRIPAAIKTNRLPYDVPSVAHCGFTALIDSPAQLNICDSDEFCLFFQQHGTFPPVDVIILDEYHLNRPNHVKARALLSQLAPQQSPPSAILVSATPPDEPPPPVRTSGLTINEIDIPDPLTLPTPAVFQLRKLERYGNNILLIIVDGCAAGHILAERLVGLGEPAACICPCMSREKATDLLASVWHNFTFIATPETEAGLDVACSHMVNNGTAIRVVYRNGIVYTSVFKLGPRQRVQRLARAGRSCHTIVFTQRGAEGDTIMDACSPVDGAAAAMEIFAISGTLPDNPDALAAYQEFPRLKKVTREAVQIALEAETPVLELYRRNAEGEKFREFGGTADGFVEECGSDLRLFKWPGGTAFAPFLDLTSYHDPEEGQTLESIKSLAFAALKSRPHLKMPDMNTVLEFAEGDPEAFAKPIWLALKQTEGTSNLVFRKAPTWTPEQRERCSTPYMFGNLGHRAWSILERLGGSLECSLEKDVMHRTLTFRGDRFNYNSKKILDNDTGKVSERLVTDLLLPHLYPISVIYLLQSDPTITTNLQDFKQEQARSGNQWFKDLQL